MPGLDIPLVLVPCFSGAPWKTDEFPMWKNHKLVTGQLPNAESIDKYADIGFEDELARTKSVPQPTLS